MSARVFQDAAVLLRTNFLGNLFVKQAGPDLSQVRQRYALSVCNSDGEDSLDCMNANSCTGEHTEHAPSLGFLETEEQYLRSSIVMKKHKLPKPSYRVMNKAIGFLYQVKLEFGKWCRKHLTPEME